MKRTSLAALILALGLAPLAGRAAGNSCEGDTTNGLGTCEATFELTTGGHYISVLGTSGFFDDAIGTIGLTWTDAEGTVIWSATCLALPVETGLRLCDDVLGVVDTPEATFAPGTQTLTVSAAVSSGGESHFEGAINLSTASPGI